MAAGGDHSAYIAERDARLRAAQDGHRELQTSGGTTDWGLQLALWLKPAADAINSAPDAAAAASLKAKEIFFDKPQAVLTAIQYATFVVVAIPAVILLRNRMR